MEPTNESPDLQELTELREEVDFWRLHMAHKLIRLDEKRLDVDITNMVSVAVALRISPSMARAVMTKVPQAKAELEDIASRYGLDDKNSPRRVMTSRIGIGMILLAVIVLAVLVLL